MSELLDCSGLLCPMPIVKGSKAKGITSGEELLVRADEEAFEPDIRATTFI
jgi:TusA-related sulfurtransferase